MAGVSHEWTNRITQKKTAISIGMCSCLPIYRRLSPMQYSPISLNNNTNELHAIFWICPQSCRWLWLTMFSNSVENDWFFIYLCCFSVFISLLIFSEKCSYLLKFITKMNRPIRWFVVSRFNFNKSSPVDHIQSTSFLQNGMRNNNFSFTNKFPVH